MPRQLDIFEDSRDVMLRNDLAQALVDGRAEQASRIAAQLSAEYGADPVLAPAAELIAHLRAQQSQAARRLDADTLAQARQKLDDVVVKAAIAVLGSREASRWLATQWRWLAGRAEGIAWDPAHADVHPAALYLRAQDWAQAAAAVAGIASWRRIPTPLLWMACARWHGDGPDAAWSLLAEALWLAPGRAAALLRTLADRDLDRLVDRFDEHFDPAAGPDAQWAWLPAFALVALPRLAVALQSANPPAESAPAQGFQLVQALLRLERHGRHHDIVSYRARLRALSAPLFSAYMSTR